MLTWPLFYYDIPTKNAFKDVLYHDRRRYVDISEFQSMRLPLGDEMTVDEDHFSKRLGES